MMRWWWFGPAVTKPEIEREMRLMKEGGIGGFEVTSVYPLALDDPSHGFRNYPYLSDEHIDALKFTAEKARELGLRMDLTLGSGWPYGGPHIPITQAAGKLRTDIVSVLPGSRRVPLPNISAGERLMAVFLAPGDPKNFAAAEAREITSIDEGAVHLPAQITGPHVLLFFIAGRTGMQVKRPAIGAEGFVLDHFDRAAVENHLKAVGDRLMEAFGENPPYAIFCDSLEVYGSDWTDDFLTEFQKRRGYDLKPHLPALVGDIGEKTAAIRHDWGQTLTELFDERFLIPMEEWAKQHHTLLRAQLYGTPPASLSSYRLVDLGEGENPRWKQFTPTKWASSANHLYGRTVTSEETWTWLHSPVFRATPLDMKAEADLDFLQGVNQLIGHGWPYSPEMAGEPGWRFYAAAVFNQHNPWWLVMPDVTKYLQRVSFMMRQGRPVNDVAIYLPTDDAWSQFSPGKASLSESMTVLLGPNVIPQVLEAGFNFDYVDDASLQLRGEVASGALKIGENRYPIIILPGAEHVPLKTMHMLEDFVRRGGILIALRRAPSLAPGLSGRDEQTPQIIEISKRLFGGPSSAAHLVADETKLGATLSQLSQPDVSLSPAAPDLGIGHRSTPSAEIYFVANTGNQRVETGATFRASDMEPEWWDPFSGQVNSARVTARPKGGVTVELALEPYESRVLVFSHRAARPASPAQAPQIAPLDLSRGWKVTFAKTGKVLQMDHLRSWTDDEDTRFFAGQAEYEKTISIPASMIQPSMEYKIDFGQGGAVERPGRGGGNGIRAWYEGPVREAAVVYVNGDRAGSVWHAPYSVDVTKLLRAGQNTIRVAVANLAINGLAGQSLPDYKLLNLRFGERFSPQDLNNLQPQPSGLLGTIRLISIEARQSVPAK